MYTFNFSLPLSPFVALAPLTLCFWPAYPEQDREKLENLAQPTHGHLGYAELLSKQVSCGFATASTDILAIKPGHRDVGFTSIILSLHFYNQPIF